MSYAKALKEHVDNALAAGNGICNGVVRETYRVCGETKVGKPVGNIIDYRDDGVVTVEQGLQTYEDIAAAKQTIYISRR